MAHAASIPIRPLTVDTIATDSLSDSILFLLTMTVVQRVVGFARAILFCRWLSPEQLGRWDMAFGFLMLAAPLSVLSISGAFGRYVQYYQRQGQVRSLIRRTALFCAAAAASAWLVMCTARRWFSVLIFGVPDQQELVVLLAGTLVGVVGFNYLGDLFTGLRSARRMAGLQLINGLAFAGLSVGLLVNPHAATAVVAYGAAALVSMVLAIGPLRRIWNACPESSPPLGHGAVWAKLLPFAAGVWISGFMANLFDIVDRYMILHFSRGSVEQALAEIGQYHSSRLVPLLLVSITWLVNTILTPYLSHDWEHGRRQRVSARVNFFVKLIGVALLSAGTTVLCASGWLFNVALGGKYALGLSVLPWTLTYCTWFALSTLLQNYLWCAEKTALVSLAMLVGLLANVGLNLLLLPRLGLPGAVMATTTGSLVMLSLVCGFCLRLGLRIDRGAWLTLALPAAFCLGPRAALIAAALMGIAVLRTNLVFRRREKAEFLLGCRRYLRRFQDYRSRRSGRFGPTLDAEIS